MAQVGVHHEEPVVPRQTKAVEHCRTEPAVRRPHEHARPGQARVADQLFTAVAAVVVADDQLEVEIVRGTYGSQTSDQRREACGLFVGRDNDRDGFGCRTGHEGHVSPPIGRANARVVVNVECRYRRVASVARRARRRPAYIATASPVPSSTTVAGSGFGIGAGSELTNPYSIAVLEPYSGEKNCDP